MDADCISNNGPEKSHILEYDSQARAESSHLHEDELKANDGNLLSDDDSGTETGSHLYKANSLHNIFVELAVSNEGTDRSADMVSDSDDSIIFCSDPEAGSQPLRMEKPKDILAEVSDILISLSDDQRFTECVNYSNNSKVFMNGELDKHRSSVDLIFTYNVLGVLYNKLRELKAYFELLQSENNKLLKESQIAEAEHFAYQVQVETLQKLVDEQRERIKTLSFQLENEMKNHANEKKRLDGDLKSARKKYEEIVYEKDAVVVRYAKNESELINIRKEKENLLKRLKNVENERDDLTKKVKSLTSEKISVSQTLDSKKIELQNAIKNVEKFKEELNYKDIKVKWVEENLQKDLNRYKEQNAAFLAEIEELKKQYYSTNQNNNGGDSEPLIGKCHQDSRSTEIPTIEVDCIEHAVAADDNAVMNVNNDFASTVEKLELQRLEYEKNLNDKDAMLREHLTELEVLRSTLKLTQNQLELCRNEVDKLKETNDELRQDMKSCREREAEMLNFTEKLTAKNVILQSENTILEAKKTALEADRAPIEERIKELEEKVVSLSEILETEINARAEDVRELTQQLENKTREIDELSVKLEEQEAENQSLKHKYSSTIRALTKEVQQYRKCKQYEAAEYGSSSDSVCLESRTSSCNSLSETPQSAKVEPDRQTLIERIVKLQKLNAKHSEKIEFLEEHIAQMLTEIKKKNRVIQHYVMREQSGVLSSDSMDRHKAELSKYGGIMATLYNPKGDNNALSLELSLEINRKLQAVLEDTILKNMTLKDSIETLGKEIEKLTSVNATKGN